MSGGAFSIKVKAMIVLKHTAIPSYKNIHTISGHGNIFTMMTLRSLVLTKSGIKYFISVVHLQPMPEESLTENLFEDATIGMNIPKNFIPSIEKVMNDVYVYTLVTVRGPKQVELFF